MYKHITRISSRIYGVRSGKNILVIERARFVLRRGVGRRMDRWLKYLTGVLSTTMERIMICLGIPSKEDIDSWLGTHEGEARLTYLLFEFALRRLGVAKVLAMLTIALKQEPALG